MRAKQLAAKQWLDGLGLLPVFQEVELRVEVRLEDPVEHLLRLLFWSFFLGGGVYFKKDVWKGVSDLWWILGCLFVSSVVLLINTPIKSQKTHL